MIAQEKSITELENKKELAIQNQNAAEVVRLTAKIEEEKAQLVVAQEKSKEAEFQYQVALNNEEQAQLSLQKAQLAETNSHYEALSGLTGPMSTILGL